VAHQDIRGYPTVRCHQGQCWAPLQGSRNLRHDTRRRELACDQRCAMDCEKYPNRPCPECPCKQHPKHQEWSLDTDMATRLLAAIRGMGNDRRL